MGDLTFPEQKWKRNVLGGGNRGDAGEEEGGETVASINQLINYKKIKTSFYIR